jgi:hypothetical protein
MKNKQLAFFDLLYRVTGLIMILTGYFVFYYDLDLSKAPLVLLILNCSGLFFIIFGYKPINYLLTNKGDSDDR